jgi:hypothetical protein
MFLKAIKKKVSNFIYRVLLLHVYTKARYKNILFKKSDFLIIVIAFNNTDILRMQYEYLQKNLEEKFDYVVADNSSDTKRSLEIRIFCEEHAISYVRLPRNPLTNIRMSGSHAIALNWCYRNIVSLYKPTYFGFLDHDIFPIVITNIKPKILHGFWGVIRTRKEKWYFWPGFSFFEYEKVKNYRFNFFPHHADSVVFLDTGGSNYNKIYKHIHRNAVGEAKSTLIDIVTKKEFVPNTDSSKTFELIDNSWLHLRQISWRKESFGKMNEQSEILSIALEHLS